uniref:Thioredoxin-like fold domain-containing protein n=1 Tax=Branchiostoma floridae TaxID=7739 RepID=C3Z428_BRAFL|eukprot:XP_002596629.1 hypothetical protein BRAFLDRAFT_78475 [Branchiostoma floridae]
MVWKWMDAIFEQQDDYKMPRTNDMSDTQIIDKLAKVAESIGVSSKNFTSQVNNQEHMVYEDARVAWKYGCIRGVAGTPWYLLNGVPVNASPNWTVAQWKQIIDSLLKQQGVFVKETINDSSTCPNHEKKCDYLPGKFECCTKGESCIPNVGCRC